MMIIDIRNLCKSFKSGREELKVLRGFDLPVEQGSIVTIRGESGSGKSTLLNIIGGLDRADAGIVRAAGFDLNEMDESELTAYRSNVLGFIFQFHYLLSDFTALENVMLPAFIRGISKSTAQKTALALLKEVRLTERTGHYPAELSGGERQRVAVARALINNPRLLLADEPTGNLDEDNSRMVEGILFTMVKERNTSLVLVSHDPVLAGKGDVQYRLVHGVLTRL